MEVEFECGECKKIDSDLHFNGGHSEAIVNAFRRRMQVIRAAIDERAFYAMKSLHFEKLAGDRSHQRSMRLNKQWRLILELRKGGKATVVAIVGIEDYH